MIALPGFFMFEMLSPLVEFSGYLLLPVLWALGMLSPEVAGSSSCSRSCTPSWYRRWPCCWKTSPSGAIPGLAISGGF